MKKLKTIALLLIASTLFLSSCNVKANKVNANKELAASEVETDPVGDKLNELANAAVEETKSWYEKNKDAYAKYDEPIEISYFLYTHFVSTLKGYINQLDVHESNNIYNYINSHYYPIKDVYRNCFELVNMLMTQKYSYGADHDTVHDMYEVLIDIMKNATYEEQKGFLIIYDRISEIIEMTLVVAYYSPFHIGALVITLPIMCYAFANVYDTLTPEQKEYVDAFKARFPDFFNLLTFIAETRLQK